MATEADNVNAGALGTLLSVGAISTLGIALVVTALVRTEMKEEVEKKEVSADRAYRDLVAEQTAQLNAPAAVKDRAHGLISLPIERAMELTVSGLAKDPNSATPPAPVGGSGGTAAAESGGTSGSGGSGGSAPAAEEPAPSEPAPEPKAPAPAPSTKPAPAPSTKPAPKPAPVAPVPAKSAPVKPAPVTPNPAPAPAPAPTPAAPAPHAQ